MACEKFTKECYLVNSMLVNFVIVNSMLSLYTMILFPSSDNETCFENEKTCFTISKITCFQTRFAVASTAGTTQWYHKQ